MSKLHRYYEGTRTSTRLLIIVALCALCIAINILGAQIALAMKLPVYLDSAGTMLAAILGGYVPAIIVGYLTNVINGIADSTTMLYGIINVLIALLAAFLCLNASAQFKEQAFSQQYNDDQAADKDSTDVLFSFKE